MPWNQQLGPYQFGICCRESTNFTAREENFDFECVLGVKDDTSESHRNYKDCGTMNGNGCSTAAVKYLLVMGNEYGDKKHYMTTPRPDELSHMQISTCMSTRITPEATDRINFQNEQLTDVVLKLLKLIRPFSYS
mgnify:CR=1 FL=1